MNPNNQNNRISLDLSLGIGPHQEQGQFMQLLRSVSDPQPSIQPPPPPPPHHMTPHGYYNNVINPWNVPGMALLPSPPPGTALLPSPSPYPQSGKLLQPPQQIQDEAVALEAPRSGARLGRPPAGHQARRNNSSRAVAVEKNAGDKEIEPPYPWATTRPAFIQSLRYLISKNINVISGQVHCRPCENTQTVEYNLKEKFDELFQYINNNKEALRQRAPIVWTNPKLIPCGSCESGMKPVISEKKEEINWLFLLLGQMLGCCTLEQLRYFCDKTKQHRTGAKDRVLYLTYLGLLRQLKTCETFSL
ncbi:hypothetical protein EUTSA_v10023072mg [Eutrema salsugineum]|uniref:DUF7086 domain-containing protein n=1 Tax=Eutrema salsugineum TaxID=72664 RepID=V4NVR4_EUTSA|nr:uncharacterized protein LOC18025915 [Eutrema salsugineum]ESQ50921.1 hypothetical protein EUTSA_v10023072mg [Eutrema salsugineum]